MNCNKVNPSLNFKTSNILFKKTKEEKKNDWNYIQKKTEFADSKTKTLTGLSLLALLCGLPLHGLKAGLDRKMTTKEKWGAGLILLSLVFSLVADFQRINLFKQYDIDKDK